MAYTFVTGKGNGSDTPFPFTFTGLGRGYLRASDVHVETRESGTTEWVENIGFTLSGTNTIELDSPLITPADGLDNLRIRRIMPKDEPYANWNVGQNYSDFVINNSFLQQLYTMHEVLDGFIPEMNTDLNMNGFKIVGLQYDLNDPESVATVGSLTDAIEQINQLIADATNDFDSTLNGVKDIKSNAIEQINQVISEANADFDATLNAVESIQTALETLQSNVNTIRGSIQTSQAEVNEDRQFVEEQAGKFEFANKTQVEQADGDALVQAKNIGARAATFGYDGEVVGLPQNSDVNTLVTFGLYQIYEAVGAPATLNKSFVYNVSIAGDRVLQVALQSFPESESSFYYRHFEVGNGASTPWIRVYDSSALPTVTQQEAKNPNSTTPYAWTPQRVAQAARIRKRYLLIPSDYELVGDEGSAELIYSLPSSFSTQAFTTVPPSYEVPIQADSKVTTRTEVLLPTMISSEPVWQMQQNWMDSNGRDSYGACSMFHDGFVYVVTGTKNVTSLRNGSLVEKFNFNATPIRVWVEEGL